MSSTPRVVPSTLNVTPATPTLSEALAVIGVVDPETVAPLLGEDTETVGGVVSAPAVTVKVKVVL